ncbi:hypothetical protein GCM10022260_05700 [Gaetbulibacter aestuarii]
MSFVDKEPFINLGLHVKNRFKEIIFGTILGFVLLGLGLLILIILEEVTIENFNVNKNKLWSAFLLFLIVAFTEEIMFRGYVLRNSLYSFNKYGALLISSILFALAHSFNPNMSWFTFLELFVAGMLLGISYIYTKNLWFPIALHFSWNFFQTLFGFKVSGQEFYSLVELEVSDNNIINGGEFGFEGSILALIFQLILLVTIWVYFEKYKSKRQLRG